MNLKSLHFHIGLRTAKTAIAVIISMLIVDRFGTSSSKLLFAMLGAMAAVQPTFKESLESCITQIAGVLYGALIGVVLKALPLPQLASVGIGIVLVITLFNFFRISFSPSLSCFIVVMICTTADLQPIRYALERIWDTTIGLGIGMLINTMVFPYDNSRKIRTIAESIDIELIQFLEDLFDGDDILPVPKQMEKQIGLLNQQLKIFSNQKLILKLRKQQEDLKIFQSCEVKGRMLVSHMAVLCRMDRLGRLNDENRRRLKACGADIRDDRVMDSVMEKDIVTNYHVHQILTLRRELLDILRK